MKMSKSIKDYKDAMDNIRISESFYKRTESLLTELPEIEIGKKPVISAGRVTAVLSAAAACLIVAFGVKFAVERNGNITTVETEITEITEVTEVTETASPVIDDIAESEEDDIFDADYDDIIGSDEDGEDAAPAADTPDTPAQADTVTVTQPPAPANPTVKPAERTAAPPAATAAPESKKTTPTTTASSAPEETVPLLSDISYEHVTVEITPYFNMGNIKSGENPVKKTGEDCRSIIEFIEGLTETSRKISNYSFTSLFSMQIADESIGVTFYSIYVTDLNAVVITKHDANGQVRETYAVNKSDYEALKHILFLQFGTEDDYELFSSLVSGK